MPACYRIIQTRNTENVSAINNSRPNTPNQSNVNIVLRNFTGNKNYSNSTSPPLTPIGNIGNGKYTNKNHISPINDNCSMDNKFIEMEPLVKPTSPTTSVLHNLVLKKPAISEKPKFGAPLYNSDITKINNNISSSYPNKFTTSMEPQTPSPPIILKQNISMKYSNEFKVPDPVEPVIVSKESNINQTPNTTRKNRRKSNLFTPLTNKNKNDDKYKNGEVGSGRTIPVNIEFKMKTKF